MCGIAGYFGANGSKEKLRTMAKALEHRGPDDEGFYEAEKIGFAFRRLSIIDLSTGHQPLSNEDGSIWVMLNGEIYDFQNLREILISLGYKFKTNSDTEIIVHAYEEWGLESFKKLNGMFAIAIWDSKKSNLFLVRDRFGKKPLYWTLQKNTLWFASELKSLLATNVLDKEIDNNSVALFFRTDYIPTPKTIFKNVFKLEPGHILSCNKDYVVEKNKFWRFPKENLGNICQENVLKELGIKIDTAVKKRLVSDVPLGLFLSGGLDSSVVAESAARQNPGLQAFTLAFEDSSYDESGVAKIIAKTLGLEHHIDTMSEAGAISVIEEATSLFDEPLADPSILPQLFLSHFTRQKVTVALSGDGGDELLLGYQHIAAHIWSQKMSFLPKIFSDIAKNVLNKMPSNDTYFSPGFKTQRLSRGFGINDLWQRDLAWRGSFEAKEIKDFLIPEITKKLDEKEAEKIMLNYAKESPDPSSWSAWSWVYLYTYLMDDVMVKVDRATMWHSLETRAPLLDKEVVSFLLNLPDQYKLGAWKGKRLFKEILKNKLPASVLETPKHGFGVPISKWLNGRLRKMILDVSHSDFLKKQKIFQKEMIDKMIEEHRTGQKDRRKELWSYLMFQLWYTKWMIK